MNAFEKYEWLSDYALAFGQVDGGTSKICWASDSGVGVNYCGCAQCEEARKLVPLYSLALAHKGYAENWMARNNENVNKLAKVEEWLEERIESDGVDDELTALADIIGFDLDEEVEVTLTMSMVVTVKKPRNAEIDEADFWSYSNDWIESNYEIVSTEDLSIDCAE